MGRRNRARGRLGWVGMVVLGVAVAAAPAADDLARPLAALKGVGREGKTNEDAGPAWKAVVTAGAPALFPTLEAVDDANPTSANWLRTAVEAIAESETRAGRALPAEKLEAFAKNTKYAPSARRMAYELLTAQDKAAAGRLLPGFLNDPNPDLRREAIAAELDKLDKTPGPAAKAALEKLFADARDQDQVEAIAKKLAGLGTKVDVTGHFAFVTRWHLIGPFESSQGKALTTKYRPEEKVDFAEKLKGKGGSEVAWKPYVVADRMGKVDLNAVVGKLHNAAAYAAAVIHADQPTPAEIRVASPNAVQIFLNGKLLFEREEYHHGVALDFNIGKGLLAAGPNVVVLKVCQNEQKDSWAQAWQFQLRVCDATGGKIPGLTQSAVDGGTAKALPLGALPETAPKEAKK